MLRAQQRQPLSAVTVPHTFVSSLRLACVRVRVCESRVRVALGLGVIVTFPLRSRRSGCVCVFCFFFVLQPTPAQTIRTHRRAASHRHTGFSVHLPATSVRSLRRVSCAFGVSQFAVRARGYTHKIFRKWPPSTPTPTPAQHQHSGSSSSYRTHRAPASDGDGDARLGRRVVSTLRSRHCVRGDGAQLTATAAARSEQ